MIRILSDSSTLYSSEEGREKNIDIAMLTVTINDKTYKEYEQISTREYIDIINEGYVPLSSQPAIGELLELYNKYPDDEIINISMADGLSGTYNSACSAREMDDKPERIEVINSTTLCGPHRYLVNLAVRLVDEGKTKSEIVNEINMLKESAKSYLVPNDFAYLVRGGRLSPLTGKISSILKIVPVLVTSKDGKYIEKLTTKRTFKKAVEEICRVMKEENVDEGYKIYVSHACREDLADDAIKIISQNIEGIDIEKHLLGPAFTTQGGPGCISIQRIKKY